MKSMFLLFSHKLTDEQIMDARKSLDVTNIVYLPNFLQKKWSDVDPFLESIKEYSKDFKDFLFFNAKEGDVVLIQGDYGLSFEMVDFCLEKSFIPVYATTKRDVITETDENGNIKKITKFKHIQYRKY